MKNPLTLVFRSMTCILFALGTVLLSTLVFYLLRSNLSTPVVALLYLVPVVISAALWGILPGITASIISFLNFNYFFIPPYYTFRVSHPQDFLAMVILLSVAILISSLLARIQSNLEQAKEREHEALLFTKLSQDLSHRGDEAEIARILARRIAEFLQNAEVVVDISRPGKKIQAQFPEGVSPQTGTPTRVVNLSTARGLLGEIRVYQEDNHLELEQERLLRSFASHGSLALDSSALASTETRARILEESDRLKTAILSSVSHELRTPLATIQASATSLFDSSVTLEPEAQQELQSLLLEETSLMIQLVDDLLNMSRLEAGALKLQRQWNSFAEIVDIGTRRLRRFSGNHQIEVDVSEDLPLVAIDSVFMEQVVINLVRNSLKFSPAHSTICIKANVDDQSLIVSVTNEGPPIPEEYLNHIFEKFYPMPGQDIQRGTGLGLSICKGIVEAHGGTIWAANLPAGVAFYFSIPLSWEGSRPLILDQESEGE